MDRGKIFETAQKHRRNLHRIPEIAFEEVKTADYITEQMRKLSYEIERCCKTAVIAYKKGKIGKKTIAFRADIDALRIEEQNYIDYKSTHQGFMHACGHDGHMAIMLTLAEYFTEIEHEDNILFVFQPGEEGAGGAMKIIESGVLEKYNIDEIYAGHLTTKYPAGTFVSKENDFWAGTAEFSIHLSGKGGHAAYPHLSDDVNLIGAQLIVDLYSAFHRKINPCDATVMSIGKVIGGVQANALPENFTIGGTIRAFKKENLDKIKELIKEYTLAFGKIHSIDAEFKVHCEYLPVINHRESVDKLNECVEKSGKKFLIGELEMVGEDFSFFIDKYKGAFCWIGAGFLDQENIGLHNPKFNFDENALAHAVEVFAKIVR